MIVATAAGINDIATNAWIFVVVMLLTRTLTPAAARSAVSGRTLLIIAAAFGVGAGVSNSGLASAMAAGLQAATAGQGPLAVLCAVYLCTALVSSFIGCN